MHTLLQLFALAFFVYVSSSESTIEHSEIFYTQTNFEDSAPSYPIQEEIDRKTAVMKMLIAKVYSEGCVLNGISILETDHEFFSHMSIEDIEDAICWDGVFTPNVEEEIEFDAEDCEIKDDFWLRCNILIEELHDEMYRCSVYSIKDVYDSLEMINNIYFLVTVCLEFYPVVKSVIVEMLYEFLILYLLNESSINDINISKIKEVVSRINRHDHKLRKSILPICKSFMIFNNIIKKFSSLHLPQTKSSISAVQKRLNQQTIISTDYISEYVTGDEYNIDKNIPTLLFYEFDHPVNMEKIYEKLKTLSNNWKAGIYTGFQCYHILHIYLMLFAFEHSGPIRNFSWPYLSHKKYKIESVATEGCNNPSLLIFLIDLMPGTMMDFVIDYYCLNMNPNTPARCRTLLKIVDYKKYLLNETANESGIIFEKLTAEEKLKCISAILDCYNAFITYQYEEFKVAENHTNYDYEALDNIGKILSSHLENIDSIVFDKNSDKYIQLCYALKRFTIITIECNNKNNSTSFSDYPHCLEFFKEYHKTGLQIDCIYNICFLLGKSSGGMVLKLYRGKSSNVEVNYFYTVTHMFTSHLCNIAYNISMVNGKINNILNLIMLCLIEIEQEKYENTLVVYNTISEYFNSIIGQNFNFDILKEIFIVN